MDRRRYLMALANVPQFRLKTYENLYHDLIVDTLDNRPVRNQGIDKLVKIEGNGEIVNQLVDIKWVNDLYLNGFKVSGILVESKINFNTNKFEYLVIGIGVNLYKQEFHPELQNIASSIEEQTNVVINKQQLINDILDELSNYVSCYDSTNYMKHYIQRSFIIGKKVKLQTSQELIDCVVLDIDYNGQLVIEHNKTVKSVNSAEVIKTYL